MSEFYSDFTFKTLLGTGQTKLSKKRIMKYVKKYFKWQKESDESIVFQYLFDLCDKTNEQEMDYETFVIFMKCLEVYKNASVYSMNVAIMKLIFSAIDTNNNNSLDKSEIRYALEKHESYQEQNELLDKTIETIKNRCQIMKDNEELSLVQFLKIAVKENEFYYYFDQVYGKMFDKYDIDHSGSIDEKELRILFKELFPHGIEKKKPERFIINMFDSTHSQGRTLNKQQFVKFVTYTLDEKGEFQYMSEYKFYTILCKLVDENNSGKMESEEITTLLRGFAMNENDVAKWFKKHGGTLKTYYIDDLVNLLISGK